VTLRTAVSLNRPTSINGYTVPLPLPLYTFGRHFSYIWLKLAQPNHQKMDVDRYGFYGFYDPGALLNFNRRMRFDEICGAFWQRTITGIHQLIRRS